MTKTIIRREALGQATLGILHPIVERVYRNRHIQQEDDLLRRLNQLVPFQSLLGMEKAVQRMQLALIEQQKILIIGDFDADGATSSALAVSALRAFGAENVEFLVPNRFAYGYGLTPEIVDFAKRWQPSLIITVDNGISSVDGVLRANELGIDVIITDHHLPGDELPAACAIVNPNQPADPFPSKNLAGVGVIFYVMGALRRSLVDSGWFKDQNPPSMSEWLDLVALGTVADVVPLDKNNRILVHHGLLRIRQGFTRPGIVALLEISNRDPKNLSASDLGFAIAPRLNAAGRLDDMSLGIDCLLSLTLEDARVKALELDSLNQERKQIEADMQAQALSVLSHLQFQREEELPYGLCLFDETWHQGVIGILAGRIKERFHRPVIVFCSVDEDEVKGSARSISGVHIRDVLDAIAKKYPNIITKFGGHAMAAGLSLKKKFLPEFSRCFDEVLKAWVDPSVLKQAIYTDGPLQQNDIQLELAEALQEAGPWGQQFPEPTFDNEFIIVQQRLLGEKHLKCVLQFPSGQQLINAIAFNVDRAEWPNYACQRVHAVYRLAVNDYRDLRSVQLMLEHLTKIE